MSKFSVSTVYADGLALLSALAYASTEMIKSKSCIHVYLGPTIEGKILGPISMG